MTCLLRHSVTLVNEWQSLYHSQYKVLCEKFLGLWLLNHWKMCVIYKKWCSKFPRRGRKSKIQNPIIDDWKIVHRPTLAMHLKRFLLSVRQKVITWEFCKLKVKPIVCFVMIQCIFLPWTYHQCRINLTTKSRNQVAYFSYVTPVVIWSKNVTIPAFLYFVEWTWVFCFLKYWIVARFVVVS